MRTIVTSLIRATIVAFLVLFAASPTAGAQSVRTCSDEDGCAVALTVSGLIDPVVADFLTSTVQELDEGEGFVAAIIVLNSEGSVLSDDDLSDLVSTLNEATIPVSIWVGPPGIDGRGAKALGGAAEMVAAIDYSTAATGATIGEVDRQRLDRDEFGALFEADASEAIESTLNPEEAEAAGIIDAVKDTLPEHVLDVEGIPIKTTQEDGRTIRQLETEGISQGLPLGSQFFHTAASPAVAYLMLGLAIGLLLFEFFTAGVGVAGVVGAIMAIMAGYGLSVLPLNTWALILCLLAAVAFFIDIQTAIPRFWTTAGLAMWIVGSIFLYDGLSRPWIALVTGIGGMAVTMFSGMPSMVRSRFATPTLGRDGLLGQVGVATEAINPDGVVTVDGGIWRALVNRATPIEVGDEVRVVAIDGLTLEVEPLEGGAKDYREMRGSKKSASEEGPEDEPDDVNEASAREE